MRQIARTLLQDERGAVALIFGLCLLPLLMAAGAALDYARATSVRTNLLAAADAAALAAVTPQAMTLPQGKAKQMAQDVFNARAAALSNATKVKPNVEIADSNGQRTATVTFEAEVPTSLMQVAGYASIKVGENARASSALPIYIDFHLLLDNTPSMGVAATLTDISTMVNNTPDKCAFACHDLSANGKDYYALAKKKLGVTLRIDVVREATQQLMDTADASALVKGQYRMALNAFGTSCESPGLHTVSALTDKLSTVKGDANKIDLMTIPYQNYNNDQCTDFDGVFAGLDKQVAAAGDGSAAAPQKMVFFVSDGVADAYYPSTCSRPTTGGRCQEPIKVSDCKLLKDRGVKVAVLYTTYLPLPTNSWYNTWIAPFAPDIGKRMEACASPGYYFEVSPSQGISDAMQALFKKTISQARLSQ